MNFKEGVEFSSQFLGRKILNPTLGYLRKDFVGKFNIVVYGEENLQAIIEKPHIIFSNHNGLKNVDRDSGLRPDHLFIFNQIKITTGQEIVLVAQTDNGPNTTNGHEKFLSPLVEGLYKGLGDDIIPVKNKPGKLNRKFIPDMNKTLDEKYRSILIFPQVLGEPDYNPNLPFRPGVYQVERKRLKQGLIPVPLIPVCVIGCDSWMSYKSQQVKIKFGEPFDFPKDVSKDEFAMIMRDKISELRIEMN